MTKKTNILYFTIIAIGALVLAMNIIGCTMEVYDESESILSTREGGKWHEKATWIGRKIPDNNDRVFLNGVVKVGENVKCNVLVVENNAKLIVDTNVNFEVKTLENYGKINKFGNLQVEDN